MAVLDLWSQLDHICLNFNVLDDMNIYWVAALVSVVFASVIRVLHLAGAQNIPAGQLVVATRKWTEDIWGMVAPFMFACKP